MNEKKGENMTETYLVYEVGFEGIDDVHGPFSDSKEAVKFAKKLKADYTEKAVGDDEWWFSERAKRVCLRRGTDNKGFECVCGEFELGSGELVLY